MKPSLPQGTRDFNATIIGKRNYIFDTIRTVFELYGFQPIETPAMENLDTLMGKYGEEGDKLIFKILNNGLDNPAKHDSTITAFEKIMQGKNTKEITERALRYDLTIPFARYVAMNIAQLTIPFKRYQIQPVWRADRPQRGRYREFYQCDADMVGSYSLLNEVELANIYATVFNKLGIRVEIKLNSRKILAALAETIGDATKLIDITIAIDKLDKIGLNKVKEELIQRGLNNNQINTIEQYLMISGSNEEKLNQLQHIIGDNELGKKGIEELAFVLNFSQHNMGISANLIADFTLARGLNYYTGIIFEVKATDVIIGSIGGGGRYDDLTGTFGVPNVAGVGISFGVDRIYDVIEELNLFPTSVVKQTQVLFFNLGTQESIASMGIMQLLREKNIRCEIYPDATKLDKQFKYAEKKNIAYVVIIGTEEIKNNLIKIKNIESGQQHILSKEALLQFQF